MTAFLLDTFAEGADTELSLHAPETGGAWVRHPSYATTATILGAEGRARGGSSSADSRYINNAAPPSADYEVKATCRVTSTSSSNRTGVLARYDASANTGYAFWSNRSTWTLERINAGVVTTLGTYAQTLTANTDYVVRLAVHGDTVEAFVGGVSVLFVQDSAPITAAGRAGVFVRLDSRIDAVEALPLTAGQPALYAQQAVEVLMVPDPDPVLAQVAVEALILQHVDAQLAQVAVEVMTREGPSGPTQHDTLVDPSTQAHQSTAGAIDQTHQGVAAPSTQAHQSTAGALTQTLKYGRPTSEIGIGSWVPSSGTELAPMVNELNPDDATYIAASAAGAVCDMALTQVGTPGPGTVQVMRYRAWSPAGDVLMTELVQGSTVIASWARTLQTTPTTYMEVVTAEQAATITDYSALRVKMTTFTAADAAAMEDLTLLLNQTMTQGTYW